LKPANLLLMACLLLALPGCKVQNDIVFLRMGHGLDVSHPVHKAMEMMAGRLREKSGGTVLLKIYPSEQLGSEREMIELVQLGALDLVKTSTSPLEGFVPVIQSPSETPHAPA